MFRSACVLVLAALLAPSSAHADVRLARVFGAHMVLQRNARVHVFGRAAPGELIRVRPDWYENDAAVTADLDGRFDVALETPDAGGPHTLRFTGKNVVTLEDVQIGEVWLASGQSNMEMGVGRLNASYSGVQDFERELADAERPRIRLFTVRNSAAPAPQEDVEGSWSAATRASVAPFSATAWFFAKHLERELDVPIGIVAADWGGTPAEAWTSAGALAAFPRYAEALAHCAEFARDPSKAAAVHAGAAQVFGRAVAELDPLSAAHAESADFDDRAWSETTAPGAWPADLAQFDGIVWMRRSVVVPAAWAGRELELELSLGAIDDDDRTWFCGKLLGATEGCNEPRRYTVHAADVRAGKAVLAVRILDTGGPGGFHGRADELWLRPAGESAGIPLAGAWRIARGAELAQLPPKPAPFVVDGNTPSALFNGMIAPLAGVRFAGVLWYQGESNVGRAAEYAELFPALIRDWRRHFQAELPFLYVQIAPYAYGADAGQAGDLREAQAAALALPATAMVVTLDIGDPADIHPKNKQEVGRRLACLALRDVYGQALSLPAVPEPVEARLDGGTVRVRFDSGGLVACGKSAFELAGADGRFLPAEQASIEGAEVLVLSRDVPVPAMVRYGWAAAAAPSVRGAEGAWPIAPFRVAIR